MKRIIRLTEQDLARIVRRVIRENNMILSEDEPGGMGLSPKTIMLVQQKHAITPDGKLGPLTLSKMGIKPNTNPTTGYAPPVSAPPVSESRRRYRNY